MLSPPKQDWKLYDEKCLGEHLRWLRSLTPEQSLELYEEFHRMVSAQAATGEIQERMKRSHWEEKLEIRRKLNGYLLQWDQVRSERDHPKDSG